MKLLSLPLSPYAARVRGAIYAKNLPVEIAAPPEDWRTSAEYRALNPAGRVPILLLDDDTTLPESAVIVEYLEDAFPEIPLRPKSAQEIARVRLITAVADLYVMQVVMPIFPLLNSGSPDRAAVEAGFDKLHAGLAHLNGMLRPGAYAHGDRLSIADIWLAPVRFTLEGMMSFGKRPDLLNGHTAVAGYTELVQRDPALSRVWQEMTDGLKAFMATRSAQVAAS